MVITPFGDLEYGDQSGLDSWLAAHDQRHKTERQTIAVNGVALPSRSMEGPLNQEWLGRHMVEHQTLKDFALPDTSVNSLILEMSWNSEENFYKWHQIHNELHSRLDQALGLT
jgi:hypothetical protein